MADLFELLFYSPSVAREVPDALYMRFIAYRFLRSVHAENAGRVDLRSKRPRPETAVEAVFVVFDIYGLHYIILFQKCYHKTN
jgi:hypothetical protein